MKCPYCGIDYNSPVSFNAHVQNCFYKDKPNIKQEDSMPEILEYKNMKYGELKSLASTKGINANRMKKEAIIKALYELEG